MEISASLDFTGLIWFMSIISPKGEFLVARAGLGYLIVYGSQIFKLDWVMLSVIILAVLAALMYQLIVLLEKKFMKWRE